jgi:glycosyltransferase involved in cell wall biosynthesis
VLDGVPVWRFRYAPDFLEQLAGPGGMVGRVRDRPWRVLLIPLFLLGLGYAIGRAIRAGEFSVIHAHWLIPQGFIAAAVNRLQGRKRIPLLCTSHGGDLFALRAPLFRLTRSWLGRAVSHVTVVSRYMREVLLKEGLDPNKISVLPMGVDLKEAFTPQLHVQRSPARLIFVGRLVEKKGVRYLLEAYARLLTEFPRLELEIVGDGPERGSLHALAVTLGLEPSAIFVGAKAPDELPGIYSAAAIAVIPSVVDRLGDQEGLGLVTVEAMGCGCAVVASDLPAIRDVVTHAQNGLLARAGDSEDLADKLRSLVTDSALRARLVQQARLDVCERFDWTGITAGYASLYASLAPLDAPAASR